MLDQRLFGLQVLLAQCLGLALWARGLQPPSAAAISCPHALLEQVTVVTTEGVRAPRAVMGRECVQYRLLWWSVLV
eukprot:m.97042 g.97042  ORF g.97042 m.97042 type:complete len:76 (+) comp15208_c5_seq2:330-557(+)